MASPCTGLADGVRRRAAELRLPLGTEDVSVRPRRASVSQGSPTTPKGRGEACRGALLLALALVAEGSPQGALQPCRRPTTSGRAAGGQLLWGLPQSAAGGRQLHADNRSLSEKLLGTQAGLSRAASSGARRAQAMAGPAAASRCST